MKYIYIITLLFFLQGCDSQPKDVLHMADAEYAKYFKCPESFKTVEERTESIREFLNWAMANHPNWTLNTLIRFRMKLLEEKQCYITLQNINKDDINFEEHIPISNELERQKKEVTHNSQPPP